MKSTRNGLTGLILSGMLLLLAACNSAVATPEPMTRPVAISPQTQAETTTEIAAPPAEPASEPLVIADFDSCSGPTMSNSLGGALGAAYNSPDALVESYVEEPGRGCVAKLEYQIQAWAAFWQKLQGKDFTPYADGSLAFDIRAEPAPNVPGEIKVELKRFGDQVMIQRVSGISEAWQTIQARLSDFESPGYGSPFSGWSDMAELVFTFEHDRSGAEGTVYLDNIVLNP